VAHWVEVAQRQGKAAAIEGQCRESATACCEQL
jgi:hypothetical protein